MLSWLPESILVQFKLFANVYFLIINLLTLSPISPKSPLINVGTFFAVLIFDSCRDGYQDYGRYTQDREINNKQVSRAGLQGIEQVEWKKLRVGDIIKINKDEEIPADCLIIHSSSENGFAFVDTVNLDGETNLKEKHLPADFAHLTQEEVCQMEGTVFMDKPNDLLEQFEGTINTADAIAICE